ncbi:NADPH:adrenodoxin oxidoreductase, mitochondrial [Lepeophtheirus salmonis]|uniref:NADPH:adrenodoxin oxidoreductase, mitochondrial n=1 Tax=Lepeophtheirus salmonis TaxID=72036 RepID=A0A0K2T0Q9_LEPSM|nr:NADPH:adrenodoxin oxidoreductase, mitochondrial-like [Lepeophtheirus salmonis]
MISHCLFKSVSRFFQQPRLLYSTERSYRICIVGSGPAGFYVAQQLLKDERVHVDILERLPVPFGLVRYGVAPDHSDVKNVDNTFTKVAQNPRFRFFGNVSFGDDVSYSMLKTLYSGVVLAYGAASARNLNIPGENLDNVISGKDFVGYYNGLPQNKDLPLDLTSSDTAVIVGVGNVALDIARILLSPLKDLKKTDISEEALDKIANSKIKRVLVVGRRGPLQVSFTIKELREMLHLEGVRPEFSNLEYYSRVSSAIQELKRPKKRLVELLVKSALQEVPTDKQGALWSKKSNKSWNLKLLRSPFKIHAEEGNSSPSGISFKVNTLLGDQINEGQKIQETEDVEFIESGLIITSVGYKSIAPPEGSNIPFDQTKGIIPNKNGKVNDDGLYVSGWLGTGPKGVIADTMTESHKVGRTIMHDINSGLLPSNGDTYEDLTSILRQHSVTTWADWEKIDTYEKSLSSEKPRCKLTTISSMMKAVKK